MSRVYLDARAATGRMCGVSRYCHGLIPELVAQAPNLEFIIIHAEPSLQTFGGGAREVRVRGTTLPPTLASAGPLRRVFSRLGPADIFHGLFQWLPLGIRRGGLAPARTLVTIHDLIWIDYPDQIARIPGAAAFHRRVGELAMSYALRTADHVVCNSIATVNSVARFVAAKRCTPVHLGVSDVFRTPPAADARPPYDDPYVVAFGVRKPYKNIACLVRAFALVRQTHPDLRLVLIGDDGLSARTIKGLGLRPFVRIVPVPSDATVRDLIRGARVLVVPSLVEGFGLPAVEAMAVGTPVVVSNAAALKEVTGGAALVVDPTDPAAFARAISRILQDQALAERLAARGRARAAYFTWSRAAAETLRVYERLLKPVGSGAGSQGAASR
jgi:glycosyltransferase involved in cell wall biosynthesis